MKQWLKLTTKQFDGGLYTSLIPESHVYAVRATVYKKGTLRFLMPVGFCY